MVVILRRSFLAFDLKMVLCGLLEARERGTPIVRKIEPIMKTSEKFVSVKLTVFCKKHYEFKNNKFLKKNGITTRCACYPIVHIKDLISFSGGKSLDSLISLLRNDKNLINSFNASNMDKSSAQGELEREVEIVSSDSGQTTGQTTGPPDRPPEVEIVSSDSGQTTG